MPFPRVLRKGELCFLSYKKEDFTSFEITSLDGERLMYTESNFDFPIMYDLNDNIIDNMLMIKGKRMPEIDTSQYVYVIARMRDGDRYRYKTNVSVSTDRQLNVIKTNERAFITLRMQEGDDKPTPLDPPAEIYIKDINVGGVFFICTDARRHFAKGDKLLMIINLAGSRLELNAEVLRELAIDSQETDTGYGCRFIGVSHSQEETISRYIYKLQFEMLQKEREKRDMI